MGQDSSARRNFGRVQGSLVGGVRRATLLIVMMLAVTSLRSELGAQQVQTIGQSQSVTLPPIRVGGPINDGVCTPGADKIEIEGYSDCLPFDADCDIPFDPSTPEDLFGWRENPILLPKFSPEDYMGGHLVAISIAIDPDDFYEGCIENLSPELCPAFQWSFFGWFDLDPPPSDLLNLNPKFNPGEETIIHSSGFPISLDPGDQTPDCIGAHVEEFEVDQWATPVEYVITDPAELALWVGTGNVTYSIRTDGEYTTGGCSNIHFVGWSFLRLPLTVTYTYCTNFGPVCDGPCDGIKVFEDDPTGAAADAIDCVTDPDGDGLDPLTLMVVDPLPEHGVATAIVDPNHPNGAFIHYIPTEPNYCGSDKIFFTIKDVWGNPLEGACEIPVEINPQNDPPVALDDSYNRQNIGNPINLPVCDNDYDPDALNGCGFDINCSSVELRPNSIICDPPVPASDISVVADGTGGFDVTFADPTYCGECTFEYRVSDRPDPPADDTGWLWSNWATVGLEVWTDNHGPVAMDDDYPCDGLDVEIIEDGGPYPLPVADNDSDPDTKPCGNELDLGSIRIVVPPQHGTVEVPPVAPDGTVLYTPDPDYCGPDSFVYRIWDTADQAVYGDLYSDTATVTLEVCSVNDAPVAVDDYKKTYVDTPVTIAVCGNDYDIDELFNPPCGAPLDCTTVTVVQAPTCEGFPGGAVADDSAGDGTILFTPPPGYSGTCSFTYTVRDTDGLISNEATVTVDINPSCPTANRRQPGSLLLFPEFDNRGGMTTILTVTNTSFDRSVAARFTYRAETDCSPFERIVELTPHDTLSLITTVHNPEQVRGYVYVTAECPEGGGPVAQNSLIGNLLVMDGFQHVAYSVNAVSFRGIGSGTECSGLALTDLDGDGLRDLDGLEYEMAPDQLMIPRFLGQNDLIDSSLVLIDLSGGTYFNTIVEFLIYNDNEEVFSTEYQFRCWAKPGLLDISAVFSQDFLVNGTNHDVNEILGNPSQEAGWFRVDGGSSSSSETSFEDPAIYAVLIDRTSEQHQTADLPFEECEQDNGALLPNSTEGDQD